MNAQATLTVVAGAIIVEMFVIYGVVSWLLRGKDE